MTGKFRRRFHLRLNFVSPFLYLFEFGSAVGAAGRFDGNGTKAMRTFFCGRVCGGSRGRLFLRSIGSFDDRENDKGNDEEVDHGLDEQAPVEFHTVNSTWLVFCTFGVRILDASTLGMVMEMS